ncbi:hypothetical protein ACTHPH_21645 [Paenibacillus pasadenensis]|uniref:hypothetical protein n=1 Tax=Paenibacillus pasadenensis TaxID=217090 RepID=UPI000FD8D5D9|nr:hypothetical protein [Paenibacillus pasadenensis]
MRHFFVGKFELGMVVATPGVLHATTEDERISALTRHINGDWGEVCEEDKQANDEGLLVNDRLLSAYYNELGEKFWIITESDRSATTFLLPSEY